MAEGTRPSQPTVRVPIALGTLMLAMLLAALDQTIVSTALPTIVGDLGGLSHISWVVTAYILAATASTPLWGKLGDQYGRKHLFQIAILIFLIGSALCGLSQEMSHLIAARALQGLGGGGLMVLTQASVGDIVSPRQRGRYQGYFGATFGLASVAGPLLGGFVVDHLSWHWVFYINLPLGILAMIVISIVLPAKAVREKHRIDYPGILLLAGAAVALVLLTSWGGTVYPWFSPMTIALAIGAVILVVLWVLTERRAAEPVLPLRLFADPVFSVAVSIAFIVGFAMFGALTYLPLFLQIVHGVSPTLSGVHLLPMMVGLFLTSVISGRLITRHGRYRPFPIAGTALVTIAMLLLSTMTAQTSTLVMSLYFFLLGLGLGGVLQVLVIAVQNSAPYEDLGAVTSGNTFFRSIGGSFGVSLFGAVFAARLQASLASATQGTPLPPGTDAESLRSNPGAVDQLPPQQAQQAIEAYADAIADVFLVAAPIAAAAFILTWFLREVPLRGSTSGSDLGESVGAASSQQSSRERLDLALSRHADREMRRDFYRRLAENSSVRLPPGSCWLLCNLHRAGPGTGPELASRAGIPIEEGRPFAHQLMADGLAVVEDGVLVLTERGARVAEHLLSVWRQSLEDFLVDWSPHLHPELREMLVIRARELLGDEADRPIGN
ncbi:MDR family MFS transporter [Actinoalloteichus hymeniacidonis]|uniref:Drug resistance transporter, EmrB/QacA subfamily n=1 Tax=Actinoalloteichus hymeniacidonis TaxID=340345 RepID=A0AAC9HMF7_9PSEU|nr:MDR family MFS transporter [Actinoalloteichus hymeniacidonis]AOS61818.1 drug resistance transporter, EmrB/QacA subfamily [Actinoalloteichus hymeniacidonis]MBB5910163.1 EmrB/QacA subfamily drug resistance transporter [Actinoalloteichus hymeniacidonis]